MRATWPGARSGRSSMTTLPLVVSIRRAFSGSLISATKRSFRFLFRRIGSDADLDHAVGAGNGAVLVGVALLDHVDELHAAFDIADDRVVALERRRRCEHDEGLGVRRIRILAAGHAHRAAD